MHFIPDDPEVTFLQPLYFVHESSGTIKVCAVTNAQLERNFTLLIHTEAYTASSK